MTRYVRRVKITPVDRHRELRRMALDQYTRALTALILSEEGRSYPQERPGIAARSFLAHAILVELLGI